MASSASGAPVATADTATVAVLPHKTISSRDLTQAWLRLGPGDRPKGEGLALRKALLDQVLDKEALARAAVSEPFVMTPAESARYLARENELISQGLYKKWVLDSLVINDADRAEARQRLAAAKADSTDPASIEETARTPAERRRGDAVAVRIKAALAPVWDDSTLALVARAFAALAPTKASLENPMDPRLPRDIPTLAPADTGRVLVRSSEGVLTAQGFIERYRLLNPFERRPPATAGEVQARGEQFIGAEYFLAEARRQGLRSDPVVVAALAERRESVALDHYYAKHIAAVVDTSEATLRKVYARDPGRYAVRAYLTFNAIAVQNAATADSMAKRLASGTSWDSLCVQANPGVSRDRMGCLVGRSMPVVGGDSVLVRAFEGVAVGEVRVLPITGRPDDAQRIVWRLVDRKPETLRTFEGARAFVVRDAFREQSEARLEGLIQKLRKAMPVRVNEAALAKVEIPEATP